MATGIGATTGAGLGGGKVVFGLFWEFPKNTTLTFGSAFLETAKSLQYTVAFDTEMDASYEHQKGLGLFG